MKVARHPIASIDVLADAFQTRRLMKVRGGDGSTADVPILPTAHERDFLLLHDIHQLRAHLSTFLQTFALNEMLVAPIVPVPVIFPLLVHVEQRQVVAFGNEELFARGVGFFLSILRPEPH